MRSPYPVIPHEIPNPACPSPKRAETISLPPSSIAVASRGYRSAHDPETLRLCIGRGITTGSHRAPPAALRHRLNFVAARPSWTNVTANPTAEWIARQITEAFPWDEAPRYLIRDRDTSYGAAVTRRLRAMGIRDRPITLRSPWQNGHVERLIGSIRRSASTTSWCWGNGTSAICWRITPPTTMGCARTLHSTRIRRSIDLRRQSGVSHQSLGSAVSIGTTFGRHNR